MTSGDCTKIGFVRELARHIQGDIPLLAKWEKSKKPTVVYAMNVEEALDYVHKMVSLGNFKNIDPQLIESTIKNFIEKIFGPKLVTIHLNTEINKIINHEQRIKNILQNYNTAIEVEIYLYYDKFVF